MEKVQDTIGRYKYYIVSMLILLALTGIFNNIAMNNGKSIDDSYNNITIEYTDVEVSLKVRNIVDTYDKNGNLYYTVTFASSDLDEAIVCKIPNQYKDRLSKDASYDALVTFGFAKEFYDKILENNKYEDISQAVRYNKTARIASDIEFMFKDYMDTSFKTEDEIHDTINNIFKQNKTEDG